MVIPHLRKLIWRKGMLSNKFLPMWNKEHRWGWVWPLETESSQMLINSKRYICIINPAWEYKWVSHTIHEIWESYKFGILWIYRSQAQKKHCIIPFVASSDEAQQKCASRSLVMNPREHRMFKRSRPQWNCSGLPRVLLSILNPRSSYVGSGYLLYNKESMLYFYVLGRYSIFQSLKHWHKCVSNPMWKPTTETELKDGEISPWIYYRLTSACSCVKIDPRLLTPGVFLGVSKYTVLPTHNPFPPPFDSDFLNLENAYSPLRYTHYCLNTCRDGCVRVCCATLLSFSCHGRYHQGPVYTVESDADWKKRKETIKGLPKAPTYQGSPKEAPEKIYMKPYF